MNAKTMFLINAVLDLLSGIALVLVPALATSLLGLQLGPVGQALARFLGCALITLGLLTFLLRDLKDPAVLRAILLSLFAGSLVATLLALVGQVFMLLDSTISALLQTKVGPVLMGGAPILVLFLVLLAMTMGYGFLLFKQRAPAPRAAKSKSAS
ncbi:MAG: hypothetical protein EHM70_10815 [Chloroflexota bacterium]|nr:MAG: hypothetical protein EHM70_10815 [Chloroflexota bacterium]